MADDVNKIRFGLSNVHVAFMKSEGEYDKPVHVPGAVEITSEAQGDQSTFYADNVAYYTANANGGYSGEITMALVPDDVKAKMLGWYVDQNGALIEDADGVPTPFAMMFEVEGDKHKRRCVLYNVTASRPNTDDKTQEESTEVTTEKMPYTATIATVAGVRVTRAHMEPNEKNSEQYEAWYTSVYKPAAKAVAIMAGMRDFGPVASVKGAKDSE